MNDYKHKVPALALKRLLTELREHRPDICFRYRMLGQMWAESFFRVANITDRGVTLSDETSNKLISIPDLSYIVQFELDKPFQSFQPYIHYEVVIDGEW